MTMMMSRMVSMVTPSDTLERVRERFLGMMLRGPCRACASCAIGCAQPSARASVVVCRPRHDAIFDAPHESLDFHMPAIGEQWIRVLDTARLVH